MIIAGGINCFFLLLPVFHFLSLGSGDAWAESMVDIFCSKLDVMFRSGCKIEVHARTPVTDARTELG